MDLYRSCRCCLQAPDRENGTKVTSLSQGDIIVSTLFDRRKLYRYGKDDPPAVVNNSCAIIRAGRESDYIVSYLRTLSGERDFLDTMDFITPPSADCALSCRTISSAGCRTLRFLKG
jgi:hypothetical protein